MADQANKPPSVTDLGSDTLERDYPQDLIVRTTTRAPEQHRGRVNRHCEVRRDDWAEAEQVVREETGRGRASP